MRLQERYKRNLKKAIEELTAEYNKSVENDYVLKPMAYTLYHLWKKWDAKEHSRVSNTSAESEGEK